MSVDKRKDLLRELESQLNARVVTLVTGDRGGLETRIGADSLPLIASLLSKLDAVPERIALFIYTPGGDMITAWGLVNLLRQYCKIFAVAVPFRALSAGTLIALGADELYIGRHGFISPIDPSVASPFNPKAETGSGQGPIQLQPVSVEDLTGFLDLARKELTISDQGSLVEVLRMMSDKIHPLALGAVYRAREQSASLAYRLLERHQGDRELVQAIVDKLTKELPTHNYLIGHDEARDNIGLVLQAKTPELETTMWGLYTQYEHWLELTQPYSALLDIGEEERKRVLYERAAIEILQGDKLHQFVFVTDKELIRMQVNQQGAPTEQIAERTVYQGWRSMLDGEVAT